jgi:hypothetical protein
VREIVPGETTVPLSTITAPAVSCIYEWGNPVSEAQNLWSDFNCGRKLGADCRTCGRLPCSRRGAIRTSGLGCHLRHDCGMAPPLFLLPRHCPLGGRTNSWRSLRFLHCRRDREFRRLARWPPLVIPTSSFLWSADGEDFYAKGEPDGQSDHVVCRSTSSVVVPTLGALWAWHSDVPWSKLFFLTALFWAVGTLASNWTSRTGDYPKARRALGNR